MKKHKLLVMALITMLLLAGCSSKDSKNDENVLEPEKGASFISLKKKEKEKKDNIIKQKERVKEENSTKPKLEINKDNNQIKVTNKDKNESKTNGYKNETGIKKATKDEKVLPSTPEKERGESLAVRPKKNEIKEKECGKIVVEDKKGKTVSVKEDKGPSNQIKGN
ncbi:hypothetical protein [Finegoldia magna]|uniref:hypothetical protein n=1 Tax=Finegoldia magna TaxID=1260 RepID=UPI0002D2ED9C|nr:hypothetical protein [Finegoldia magna]